MDFIEVEFKYDASEISLESFLSIVKTLPVKKRLINSSFDDYFTNDNDDAIRYRHNEVGGELTIKRKVDKNNNFKRIEVNLPTKGDNLEAVTEFAKLLGYKHNFGIHKTCKIYWLDKVDLVYYVVYDKELKELRRFIEIEALEDAHWESEEAALAEVIKYEKLLEPIGISPKKRMKRSLFELFKKST